MKEPPADGVDALANYGWFPRNEALLAPEGEFEAVEIEREPPAGRRGYFEAEQSAAGRKTPAGEKEKPDPYETVRRYLIRGEFSPCPKAERGRADVSVVLLVDSSGSMASGKQISHAKAVAAETVRKNRGKIVEFSGVALSGDSAHIFSPPGTGAEKLVEDLKNLKTGGRTNMSAGVALAAKLLKRKKGGAEIHIFTDGRVNFCAGGGDPFEDSVKKFKTLVGRRARATVVDTEAGFVKIGAAARFSRAIGAEYTRAGDIRRMQR